MNESLIAWAHLDATNKQPTHTWTQETHVPPHIEALLSFQIAPEYIARRRIEFWTLSGSRQDRESAVEVGLRPQVSHAHLFIYLPIPRA